MSSKIWIDRQISQKINSAAESRPAIILTGVRQSGKSSLLLHEFPNVDYVSFDHLNQVTAANESPSYFLKQYKGKAILDEIQYVPHLLRELKISIDADRDNYGKWILTGSQQFELMTSISDSLAGRISVIHLETLSAKELRDSGVTNAIMYLWRGGYPELWSNQNLDEGDFFESYLRTYVERDLRTILEVRNLSDFQRLIQVLATRIGQLINFRDISKDIGVSDVTVRKWVDALKTSGLIYLVAPYYANIGKRLTKSPKLYFADHGFACYLLGIENESEWKNHIHRGNLWENLVFMELVKTNFLKPGKDIFFYRDQNGVEIDFIVQRKGVLHFIEAKAGENIDQKKLNFKKVVPLFKDKMPSKAILLQNTPSEIKIRSDSFECLNPLLTDIKL